MSFFVTSAGSGKGAELGGIAGADRICQTLALGNRIDQDLARVSERGGRQRSDRGQRAGSHRRRSLVQCERGTCRAEPRGPSRRYAGNGPSRQQHQQDNSADGKRRNRQRRRRHSESARHDHRLQLDGTAFPDSADHTCGNYTSSATTGVVQLGHHDRTGGGNTSWNSTHPSRGCSQENLVATGGAGRFYCFAIN